MPVNIDYKQVGLEHFGRPNGFTSDKYIDESNATQIVQQIRFKNFIIGAIVDNPAQKETIVLKKETKIAQRNNPVKKETISAQKETIVLKKETKLIQRNNRVKKRNNLHPKRNNRPQKRNKASPKKQSGQKKKQSLPKKKQSSSKKKQS